MFFQAAMKGHNRWWLYLLGVLMVSLAFIIGQMPLVGVLFYQNMTGNSELSLEEFAEKMDFEAFGLDQNFGMMLMLFQFVFAFGALWMVIRYLHGRPLISLINNLGGVRWCRFWYGFGMWTLLGLGMELVNYAISPEMYHFQFQLKPFLILFLIAVVMLPIQTSFEELFIRGYLMQGLGLLFNTRMGAVLISSLIFMSLHLMNPEVGKFGLNVMVMYYFLVAVFLAGITLLDQGLELALGIHASTNIFGALFLTFEGSALQTPAVFRLEEPNAKLMLVQFIVAMGVFLFLAAKKYGWNNLNRLTGPVLPLMDDRVESILPENNDQPQP